MTLGQEHARHRLAEPLLNPIRFSIVAALAAVDEAEFAVVRDSIEVSDSVLSKQASALAAAKLVKLRRLRRRPTPYVAPADPAGPRFV